MFKCLQSVESQVRNSRVDLWCDNQAVIFAYENHGSRDQSLTEIMKAIFQFLVKNNINLHMKLITTVNNPADEPSRRISFTDCMLQEDM